MCVCVCVCVCVALVIQHAMRMHHIAICGLPRCTIFSHIISQTARILGGKNLLNTKCVFWFSLQICIWNISHSNKNPARYYHKCTFGLHVKYRLLLSDFNRNWILSKDFRKNPKILKNSSCGSRGIPRGQTDQQTWRISTVDFLYFMTARKKMWVCLCVWVCVCVCVCVC